MDNWRHATTYSGMCTVCQRYFVLWHLPGEHLVCGVFERYNATKNVLAKQKTLDIKKIGDLWLSIIKLYYKFPIQR